MWSGCTWTGSRLDCGAADSAPPASQSGGLSAAIAAGLARIVDAAKDQFCAHPELYGAAAAAAAASALGLGITASEAALLGADLATKFAQENCNVN